MFEKIKNLKWYYQLLMLVAIGGLIYTGVWWEVTGPTRAEVDDLNNQVAQLTAKNHAAEIAVEHINEFRALYASKQQEYDELKVLLPEQREITNVLQGLQDTARDSRLTVMRFSPRDDQQQDSMTAKPVEIEVDSNFNNLRSFFESMAKLPRIVSVSDFKLNQLEKQTAAKTLHAQFVLTAYYATPETLQKPAAPAKPGTQPAAAGQPAPQQPAAQQPAAK
ncbi:MAG TPA: type 4a pilus biogenesis protein PilO [Pyrinomonadaceae bacterium]